jgi:mono/diheme cytochrome c family protein
VSGPLDLSRAWVIIAAVQGHSRAVSFAGAALLIGLAIGLAGGCSNAAGPEQAMSGKQLYDRHCARCHGLDGSPTKVAPSARDLSNRSYIESLGNKGVKLAIMAGRPAGAPPDQQVMPAFGNQFSEPELELLIGYVRSLSNPELGPATLTPEAVRERGFE